MMSCLASISRKIVRFRIPPSVAVIPTHSSPASIASLAFAKPDQSGVPSSKVGTGIGLEPTIAGSLTFTMNPRIISVVENSSFIIRSAESSGDSMS